MRLVFSMCLLIVISLGCSAEDIENERLANASNSADGTVNGSIPAGADTEETSSSIPTPTPRPGAPICEEDETKGDGTSTTTSSASGFVSPANSTFTPADPSTTALKSRLISMTSPVPTPADTYIPQPCVMVKSDFDAAFKGIWTVQNAKHSTITKRHMGSSTGTHDQLPDGSVMMSTHPGDFAGYGVFEQPTPVKTKDPSKVPVGAFKGWSQQHIPAFLPEASGTQNLGILQTDKGMFYTYKAYYNVTGTDHPTQGKDGSELYRVTGEDWSDLSAPYIHNKIGGYMGRAPADMDFDYLVGMEGAPGKGTASMGPALYGIKFDSSLPISSPQIGKVLLAYDSKHEMEKWQTNERVRGVAWIEAKGKGAVVFATRLGSGPQWYGEGEVLLEDGVTVQKDIFNSNKGYHAANYLQGLWIYDPAKLRKVLKKELKPYEVHPEYWIDLEEYLPPGNNKLKEVSCSYKDGKLLVSIADGHKVSKYSNTPLILTFDFN